MLCTIVPWADAIYIFERTGKVKLIGIADHGADGADGQATFGQQLCRPCHAVVQQEPLRAFAHGIPEHLAEIAAVQPAEGGDILDGNIFAVMLLYEGLSLLHIEVPQAAGTLCLMGGRGLYKLIQKQKAVADLTHGAVLTVIYKEEHLLLQQLPGFSACRRVHRVLSADACKVQGFVGTQTVKLDPCVFPRILFIGTVGSDLTRSDQKTMPALDGVFLSVCKQKPFAGDDIVEQIVVAGIGTIGV